MDEGDIIYFEECVSGVWYKVKCKITGIEKSKRGWKAEFKSLSGIGKIAFMAEKIEDGCIFTHIESFGSKKLIIGKIVDFLLLKVFPRILPQANFDLIQKDMEEDGKRLKKILERGGKI